MGGINFNLADLGMGGGGAVRAATGATNPTRTGGFADQFMNAFLNILQIQRQRQALADAQEERDYLREYHAHQIKALKLEDKATQLKGRLDSAKLFEGYQGETPTFDFSGFEDLGVPAGLSYKPRNFAQVLAELQQKQNVELHGAQQKSNIEDYRTVGPETSAAFGGEIPIGRHPKELLTALANMIGSRVTIPEGTYVPPGRYDKEAIGPFTEQFKAGQEATRAGLQRQNNLDVAGVYAGARGGRGSSADPAEVYSWAQKVASGEATLSQVPALHDLRTEVVKYMSENGVEIGDKNYLNKIEQFTPAEAALTQLEQHLKASADVDWNDPVQKAVKLMQLNADIAAFTRVVGRASGEKGVFTDADVADFKKLISPGLIASAVVPEVAMSRINEARNFIGTIKNRYQQDRQNRLNRLPRIQAGDSSKPIIQQDTETKQYRHSIDGGRTWIPGLPATQDQRGRY